MKMLWFTRYAQGSPIFSDSFEDLDSSTVHGYLEDRDAVTFFTNVNKDIQSRQNHKLLQFFREMRKNPEVIFQYDIDKISENIFWSRI